MVDPAIYYNSYFIHPGLLKAHRIMLAAGVFMCLSSLCICIPCFTAFFHFIAFILLIVCIVMMSITVNHFKNEASPNNIEEKMNLELEAFDNKSARSIWTLIQQDLKCCGISNSSDWQENPLYAKGSVPDSCCKIVTNLCGKTAEPDDLFSAGCLGLFVDQVPSYLWLVVLFLAGLCIIVCLVICSCCSIPGD